MAPPLSKPDASRLRLRLLAATALGLASGMHSQVLANPFGAAPVSDQELSGMRGGFELPNGMNVAVAVEIETRVDGALALRTVLNLVDSAKPALQVFTPANLKPNMPDPAATPATGVVHASLPAVELDKGSSAQPVASSAISVPIVSMNETPGGVTTVPGQAPAPNNLLHSDLGAVSVEQTKAGSVVILKGPDLEIQHMTGNSTGVLVANTLDNRAIDTIATVNVSLSDSAVPVGNILLRIESIVLNAVGAKY